MITSGIGSLAEITAVGGFQERLNLYNLLGRSWERKGHARDTSGNASQEVGRGRVTSHKGRRTM